MTVTSINGVLYVSSKGEFKTYEWRDLEGKPVKQPKVSAADHSFVMDVLKRTVARMLTLVEATYSDPAQRNAQKNIIKGIFSEEMENVTTSLYSNQMQKEWDKMAEKHFAGKTDEEIADSAIDLEEVIFDRI